MKRRVSHTGYLAHGNSVSNHVWLKHENESCLLSRQLLLKILIMVYFILFSDWSRSDLRLNRLNNLTMKRSKLCLICKRPVIWIWNWRSIIISKERFIDAEGKEIEANHQCTRWALDQQNWWTYIYSIKKWILNSRP